eukprot:11160388-Lingulodinium_polyedra.AAC.1
MPLPGARSLPGGVHPTAVHGEPRKALRGPAQLLPHGQFGDPRGGPRRAVPPGRSTGGPTG